MNRIRAGPKGQVNNTNQLLENNINSQRTSFMASTGKDKKNISIHEVIQYDKEITSTKTSQHLEGNNNKQAFPRSLNLSQASKDDMHSKDSRRIRNRSRNKGDINIE